MVSEIGKRRFNVDEYYKMAEVGILDEHERVELIEGEILEMRPIGYRHWICVDRATALFTETFGRRAIVSVQNPSRLSNWTEPEPDVAVYKPRKDFYAGKRRGPEDALLILEIADSSQTYDRKVKAPLYAKAGIPEY